MTIAGSRQKRPVLPKGCPFCIGGIEAPEPYTVKAFRNRWPAMIPPHLVTGPSEGFGEDPSDLTGLRRDWPGAPGDCDKLFEALPAIGDCEVILYTPEHEGSLGGLPQAQLDAVFDLWTERTVELGSRPEIASVLIFENRGEEVGVTIHHPHGQIYAFPFVPPRQRAELSNLGACAAGGRCLTCDLIAAEENGPRLVAADDETVAVVPYASAWPYALQVIPRHHAGSLDQLASEEAASLRDMLAAVLRAGDRIFDRPLPSMMGCMQQPFDASDPDGLWHMRFEIVSPLRARQTLRYVASAEVSAGQFTNPVVPEDAAAAWRSAMEQPGG